MSDGGDDPVEGLVFECLERYAESGDEAVRALLAEHPEHAERARAELELLWRTGLLAAPEAPDSFPEKLGEFRLLERLGGGGMGVVYRAFQESLQREVALKLIRPEQLYFPAARERFRREVLAVARLQHSHIVPVHTVGETDGIPYFTMDLVAGATLDAVLGRLRGRELRTLEASDLHARAEGAAGGEEGWIEACLRFVREIAEALEHAHGRAVLHRDVKPSNLIVTPEGKGLLVDFGVASLGDSARITRSGSQPGSVPYMSPEQIRGDARVDARTDVYSLGVVLYEMLTLHSPFEGESSSDDARRRIVAGSAPRPRQLDPRIPRDVETVCLSAMAPEAGHRYASAADFARDLGHLIRHEPIEAQPAGAWLRSLRWSQRHPKASGVTVGALVLAMLAASTFVWMQTIHGRELRHERDLAQERFQEMRSLATGLLFDFHDAIRDLSGSMAARELIVKRALEMFEKLSAAAEDDASLKSDLAWAHVRLGEVLGGPGDASLGDSARAREQFERALELYDQLTRAAPLEAELVYRRARARIELATLITYLGEHERALALYRRAVDEVEAFSRSAPPDTRLESTLAALHLEIGDALIGADRLDEALESVQRALALWSKLSSEHPDDASCRFNEALSHRSLARIHRLRGQAADAERELDQALALAEEWLRREPDSDSFQRLLADGHLERAALLSASGRHEEAVAQLRASCAEFEARRSRDPRNAFVLRMLLTMQSSLGSELVNVGDPHAAIAACDAALALAQESQALGFDSEVERDTWDTLRALAEAQHTLGDDAGAAASCTRLAARIESDLARAPSQPELRSIAADYAPWCEERVDEFATAEKALAAIADATAELARRASAAREDTAAQIEWLVAEIALARAAERGGDFELARAALSRVVAATEGLRERSAGIGPVTWIALEARARLADLMQSSGDRDGASETCSQALAWSLPAPGERADLDARVASAVARLASVSRALGRGDLAQRFEAARAGDSKGH